MAKVYKGQDLVSFAKVYLDAEYVDVDDELSETSVNPVQNKVITNSNEFQFAKSEYEKSLNKFNFNDFKIHQISVLEATIDYLNKTITLTDTGGVGDQWITILENVQLKPNTTYTYSVKATDSYELYVKLGENHYPNSRNGALTFTTDSTGIVSYFRIDNECLGTNVFSEFMLNEGDVALPCQEGSGEIVHGNEIKPIILWENTNLNVEFPSTQLYIPRGRKAYVSIDAIYFSSANAIRQRFTFRNLPFTQGYISMSGSEGQALLRRVTINNDSIVFDDASPTNNYCVPVSIYEHD